MSVSYRILKTTPPEILSKLNLNRKFEAKAVLYADKLLLKGLHASAHVTQTVLFKLSEESVCIAFHFGALVFFNSSEPEEEQLYEYLKPFAKKISKPRLTEIIDISINKEVPEGLHKNMIHLHTVSAELLEVIAHPLAKSIVLDYFEGTVAKNFAEVEPIASNLKNKGRLDHSSAELLKHIGGSLLTEHDMVGKIELSERPLVLWDLTNLEPLYDQLIEEFEIVDRQTILDKKLNLLTRTAETSLEVLQHRHSSRLEWYIIFLIMVEILIELYLIFTAH